MKSGELIVGTAFALLASYAATDSRAPSARVESLELREVGELRIVDGEIAGEKFVDYRVTGEASQILSVDMVTSNAAAYFNIMPSDATTAIFVGSTQGTVADVTLRESGDYLIRVYLARAAARRDEAAEYSLGISLGPPDFADGLAGGPDYWAVAGAGGNETPNLREGPFARYESTGILRNGDTLQNRGCRLTGRERWCRVRTTSLGETGWVKGRYLVESAAPPVPTVPPGGPVGNGLPFDATGYVQCATRFLKQSYSQVRCSVESRCRSRTPGAAFQAAPGQTFE